MEVGAIEPGPELDAHLDACAARICQALDRLPDLKRYALDHAPPGWVQYYTDGHVSRPLVQICGIGYVPAPVGVPPRVH